MYRLILASLPLSSALLIACGGDTATDPGTDEPSNETPDITGITGDPGPSYLEIAAATFNSAFGVDGAGNVVPAVFDGYDLGAIFNVYLGEDGWLGDFNATNDYCVVTFDLTGLTDGGFAAGLGGWYGVDVDTSVGATTCDNLDPADWPDVVADIGSNSFELTLGTPITSDVTDFLGDYYYADTNYGVTLDSPLFGDLEYSEDCWGTAYAMEDNGDLLLDADGYGVPMTVDTLPGVYGGVNAGFYTVSHMWIWNF